jgi:hypothetical protein
MHQSRGLANEMSGSASLQMGGIAALYVLWLSTWLVIGSDAFGPARYNWDQTLIAAAAAFAAFKAAWQTARPYPPFLVMIGVGLLMLAASWATYNTNDALSLRFPGEGAPEYSDVAYAIFVFIWMCAWGYLALEQWQRRPPSTLTGLVFGVLVIGLAGILVGFYYPQYRSSVHTNEGRLDAVVSGLEFAALIAGLACLLLGEQPVVTWVLVSMALLLASDMAYSGDDVPPAIAPVWQLGQFVLLAALLAFPRSAPDSAAEPVSGAPRSGLSAVLVLLSIGCVLLSAALGLAPVHPVWRSFFSVLFVVALVVAMVWLTDRFDEAVEYLKAFASKMFHGRLQADDWRDSNTRIRTILHSTGLGAYLDWLRDAGGRLKQDVLFLGPERLYPPPKPPAHDRIRCFLVMPFSLEWSNDVHRTLAGACRSMGVHPVRGDDVFTPTDILNDIWHSIHAADFVIADITGRNPNVLYELGIAHTLAKPVLIISKNAADIPIDLSTRRVILYGQSESEWTVDLEAKVTRAIEEILKVYGLAATDSAREIAGSPSNDQPEVRR